MCTTSFSQPYIPYLSLHKTMSLSKYRLKSYSSIHHRNLSLPQQPKTARSCCLGCFVLFFCCCCFFKRNQHTKQKKTESQPAGSGQEQAVELQLSLDHTLTSSYLIKTDGQWLAKTPVCWLWFSCMILALDHTVGQVGICPRQEIASLRLYSRQVARQPKTPVCWLGVGQLWFLPDEVARSHSRTSSKTGSQIASLT